MRIAIIASSRYPIREPFAGGLEAHTWALAAGLRARGHEVTLHAADGPAVQPEFRASDAARRDVSMVAESWLADHHAYLSLMLQLAEQDDVDVVHNNSLHHLPVAMARMLPMPVLTTLHTPPTPWLESAIRTGPCPVTFVAVSRYTARSWGHVIPVVEVVPNGVDTDGWAEGPGGEGAVWFGRMVPEKGPDLAIRAARRAGMPLRLAGPVSDAGFWADRVEPLLGDGVEYVGHLRHRELARLVGSASTALVTPRWDEPYGLVAAEALSCGTPVVGLSRGGLPEVVDRHCARLVHAEDEAGLAAALAGPPMDRVAARRRAEQACSVRSMVDRYEAIYERLTG